MDDIISQPTRLPLGLYFDTRCRTALSMAVCCDAAIDICVSPNLPYSPYRRIGRGADCPMIIMPQVQ
jgi:hypothetical protein